MRNFSNFSATLLILITCFESLQLTYLWSFSHFVKKHIHPPRNTFYLHWSNYQSVVNMSRRMIHFVIRARVPPTDFYTLFFLLLLFDSFSTPFSIYSFQNPRFLPGVALSRSAVAEKSLPAGKFGPTRCCLSCSECARLINNDSPRPNA